MKRPLLRVALFYVAGLLLADRVNVPPGGLLLLSTAVALLTLLWPRARPALVWPLALLLGCTNLAWRTAILSPDDLRVLAGERTELAAVRGRLLETPWQRVYEREEEESWRTHAVVQVEALRRDDRWQPAGGTVAVTTPGVLGAEFFAGQQVEINGVLRPPKGPIADGQFDYRTYLNRQRIYYELRADGGNDWRLLMEERSPRHPPLADRFSNWAHRTLQRGLPVEDEPLRLTWAMALGWKTALTSEVSAPFMRTGTMHIFAISGLHIALIAGILVNLLRVLQVPRAACALVVIPLIWFYTAATGWQSSAIRSTVMMSVVIAGWSLNRPGDLLNSLGAAGFIILVWQPEQLFQASFQLSFFVVLSIALLLPPIEKILRRWLATDPLLPPELRPRRQRWLDAPVRFVALSLATSLAAWLGSLPLIAYYFHLFTPVSLLANLVIVPMSSAALMCNLASLLCGDWLPWLTGLFNHAGWFWMRAMIGASQWAERWPGAYFYIRAPGLAGFIIFYALLLMSLNGWLFAPSRRRWAVAGVGIFAVCIAVFYWQRERSQAQLAVLPLNGGEAVWVDAPGRRNDLLIDCGNESAAAFVVNPFLRAQGVNRLPQLLLTHGAVRSMGATETLAREFAAQQILTSSIRFRSPAYRQLLAQLERTPGRWRQINRGDRLGPWTVLHPAADDKFSQADDSALVMRGEFFGARVLLLSDLGKPGQAALLERGGDLRADIVVTGLPVQGEPVMDALLDAIRPRVLIVTASEFPATARASKALRQRLARRDIPVIYTSEAGAVTVTLRRDSWEVRPMQGEIVRRRVDHP